MLTERLMPGKQGFSRPLPDDVIAACVCLLISDMLTASSGKGSPGVSE